MDPLRCNFCFLYFSSLDTLHRHRKLHKLKYVRALARAKRSQPHARALNGTRRLEKPSRHCVAHKKSKKSKKRNQQNHEINGIQCPFCRKSFPGRSRLSAHIKTDHPHIKGSAFEVFLRVHAQSGGRWEANEASGITFYRCCACQKQFLSKTRLLGHDCMKDENASASSKDKYLDAFFKLRVRLRRLQCLFCSKVCLKGYDFLSHLLSSHSEMFIQTELSLAYRCLICHEEFTTKDQFEAHEVRHQNTKTADQTDSPASCPTSSQTRKKNSLKESLGMNTFNSENVKYKCGECHLVFPQVDALKDHFKTHVSTGTHTKSSADKPSEERLSDQTKHKIGARQNSIIASLNTDVVAKPKIHPFKCERCPRRFAQMSHLKTHIMSHVSDTYIRSYKYNCRLCSLGFATSDGLETHMSTHVSSSTFKCGYCSIVFAQLSALKDHIRSHMSTKETNHQTSSPNPTYKSTSHQTSSPNPTYKSPVSKEPLLRCSFCKDRFFFKEQLQLHVQEMGHKWHKCDQCEQQFTDISTLNSHRCGHDKEKSYRCDRCNVTLATGKCLQLHMEAHEKNKHLECTHCWMCFSEPKFLQKHIEKAHTYNKRHCNWRLKCAHCDRRFQTEPARERHVNHAHKCAVCHRVFAKKEELTWHMNSHLGEYTCQVCQRTLCKCTISDSLSYGIGTDSKE